MERVKILSGNDIELCMKIPAIKSRASNILMDKGNYVCCHKVRPIKIFIEYVGTNMASWFRYWLLTGEASR